MISFRTPPSLRLNGNASFFLSRSRMQKSTMQMSVFLARRVSRRNHAAASCGRDTSRNLKRRAEHLTFPFDSGWKALVSQDCSSLLWQTLSWLSIRSYHHSDTSILRYLNSFRWYTVCRSLFGFNRAYHMIYFHSLQGQDYWYRNWRWIFFFWKLPFVINYEWNNNWFSIHSLHGMQLFHTDLDVVRGKQYS